MTPHQFVSKWRSAELKERSASQSHFNDLCALLGILDPVSADPVGEWFTFERGAAKTGGGDGWADVWRKGCFAWEYKGRHANLDKALAQLLQYQAALENPPLLIVSDMDRVRVHTNFTNTVQEVHEFTLDDLLDGDTRERLKRAFTDPDDYKPTTTRTALTEETAREFAGLAQRLRERGHAPGHVAHFVNQLVFCMFAEDSGLLPDKLFTRMVELCRFEWKDFPEHAGTLFRAMATRGGKVGFTRIDWFNGGLFDAGHDALPLTEADVEELARAARRDWSQIDPSILGTLFERGLDPAKRSQLGAHYTDRDKIMLIVRPVIVEPLQAEWADTLAQMTALVDLAPRRTADRLLTPAERRKGERILADAAALHAAFIERLARFRVLDPACGSGNFLYVALRALKDIEHRANLDAEAIGLPRGFPRVGPENVLGIELNPYAAELARVSVWIGEIQWMRGNGFDAAKDPILRPLDTIECRDALLHYNPPRDGEVASRSDDGGGLEADTAPFTEPPPSRAAARATSPSRGGPVIPAPWPAADVIIGNPPFLGGKRLRSELGDQYVADLFAAYCDRVPPEADLVTYWVAKAWVAAVSGRVTRVGLVTTNSVRGGANRRVLAPIADAGGLFAAWSDQPWTVDGAAVRVSLLAFGKEPAASPMLDGKPAERINADLTGAGSDLTKASQLPENRFVSSNGISKKGPYEIPGDQARDWIARGYNPNGRSNAEVLTPWYNGLHVTRRWDDSWIINFGELSQDEASCFELPFQWTALHAQPVRDRSRDAGERRNWWRLARRAPALRKRLSSLSRCIVTPEVAKHRVFAFMPTAIVFDKNLVVASRDDDTTFGILHSRFHELWSLRMGTSLEDRPRYTPSTTFKTFPFPHNLTPDIPAAAYADDPRAQAIAAAAARLNELRENWLNPADLVVREPEVVPGYPDRLLPRDAAAAAVLKTRTLTNLYNTRPAWLANAHATLDQAVADAYGWGGEWRAGMTDDDLLARLFHLNQARAEVAAG